MIFLIRVRPLLSSLQRDSRVPFGRPRTPIATPPAPLCGARSRPPFTPNLSRGKKNPPLRPPLAPRRRAAAAAWGGAAGPRRLGSRLSKAAVPPRRRLSSAAHPRAVVREGADGRAGQCRTMSCGDLQCPAATFNALRRPPMSRKHKQTPSTRHERTRLAHAESCGWRYNSSRYPCYRARGSRPGPISSSSSSRIRAGHVLLLRTSTRERGEREGERGREGEREREGGRERFCVGSLLPISPEGPAERRSDRPRAAGDTTL